MAIQCFNDPSHGPVVRETLVCEACYQHALAKLKNEFLPRKERQSAPIRHSIPSEPDPTEAEADRKLAEVIARSVLAANGPVSRLDKRLSMERDQRLSRGIALARQLGMIELVNGKGFIPGPRAPPPRCSARLLAGDVWALDRPLTVEELEARYGLARRSLSRYIGRAREAGWIVNVHGKGYARGTNNPAENSDAR